MLAARAGFRWWEVDLTYSLLWLLARLRLVWDLHPVPASVLQQPAGTAATEDDPEEAHAA
jgi:stearoyl-CoA desaturase (delta-9 desaturase)